jgi:IMP dehydrogenase/GMP reductase
VASGYLHKTIRAVKELYNFRETSGFGFKIISGNVVDSSGCYDLAKAGVDGIRVGIGGGGQCLTSKSIGIGCPSLTSILDCSIIKDMFPEVMLIADGGISNPGRALKALCFGCDAIMIGSLFGRAQETNNNGVIFGMSSFKLQEQMGKSKKSNEGIVSIIPKEEIKPLEEIWNEFTFGLKSGLSYLGIDNINNIKSTDIEYIGE